MNEHERLWPVRLLSGGMLVSWLWKLKFFSSAIGVYRARPLHDSFFPEALQSVTLLLWVFLVPVALALLLLARPTVQTAWASTSAFACMSLVLCLHQCSYNDATFLTSFWAALWGLWYMRATRRPSRELAERGAFLAQAIIGLMFLGGVIGKLTPGYLDGSVLYRIYFAKRDHWSFTLLRAYLSPDQVRVAATIYSRSVLGVEACLASLPLWPTRLALRLALLALLSLVLLNNFLLFSVIGSLAALCIAGLRLIDRPEMQDAEVSS